MPGGGLPTGGSRVSVLVAGISTRAAADSAARAGFDVTAIDGFNDQDRHPAVRVLSLPGRFTARAASRVSRTVECDAVAYLASFENHPDAVEELARNRTLWGNPPSVLRRVRNPMLVVQELRARGIAAPAAHRSTALAREGPWLIKPVASGGGYGIRTWRPPDTRRRGWYFQEAIQGTPGSIVFVAAQRRAVPLAVTRQLVGEPVFGAEGFRYCGSILACGDHAQFDESETLAVAACRMAQAATEAFDLVGVNGIDFVACRGIPFAVEVNPRWSSSMELVERAHDVCVFAAHAAACANGILPTFDMQRTADGQSAVGKAVVFARHDVVVGDTRHWLADSTIRDVPTPGERIAAGRPACTVFSTAASDEACHAALAERAGQIHAELAEWC
jgi:predicted ATP-grasp superfamily ATP-dependent carboligase